MDANLGHLRFVLFQPAHLVTSIFFPLRTGETPHCVHQRGGRWYARLHSISQGKSLPMEDLVAPDSRLEPRNAELTPGRLALVIVALCFVIAVLPFLVPAIPVGTDVGKHLMVARVLADYSNPLLGYNRYFTILWRPLPAVLGDLTLAGLVKLSDPLLAVKLYYLAFAVVLWISSRFYLKSLGQPALAAILLFPLLHTFYVFSGFLPFIVTFALYPLLLGILLGGPPSWMRSVFLALTLLVLYGFHPIGAAVGCFSVFFLSIDWKQRSVSWINMVSVLPASLLMAYFSLTKVRATPQFHSPLGQIKAYVAYNVFSLSNSSSYFFILLLLLLGAVAVWDSVHQRTLYVRLLFLSAVFVAIGLVMPYQIGADFIIGSRTLPFAIITTVGALRWSAQRLRVAALAASLFLLLSSALNLHQVLAVQAPYRVFLSGMPSVKFGSKILPILGNVHFGGNEFILPFNGVEDLYSVYRGGANPYVFAEPLVRTGGNLLHATFSRSYTSKFSGGSTPDYRGVSNDYDYVICWACSPAVTAVIEHEAPLVFRNGRLSVYQGSSQRNGAVPDATSP